ncbi:hypothetical protein K7W42_15530 [Deinococcus sp. HMF7604]|uniref:M12 family metallopeptidase n=1 Tax=Deinococcus betulae TaxID=2873312 RepID=UPI001CCACA02|nr:M12 family metallopeptidase [Deinococcus betulae]MBZ9752264.1 hypothetical protein [Deinococcus betulae]
MHQRLLFAIAVTAALVSCSQPTSPSQGQTQSSLTIDLRGTELHALTPEQRLGLEQAPHVTLTLRDGSTFVYENIDGQMMQDGDIILGHSHEALALLTKQVAGRLNGQALSIFPTGKANWSNRTVPYFWNNNVFSASEISALNAAIDLWNSQAGSAVRWVWSTTATNRVRFVRGSTGCGASAVGSAGGVQDLSLACFTNNTILHEMGHASGFQHEHQRCDRDNYVVINPDYISDTLNYGKGCSWSTYGPYDYDSIMNYFPPYVNARTQPSGSYTGSPSNLGKTSRLSPADLSGLQAIYKSGGTTYTGTVTVGSSVFEPKTSAGFRYAGGTLKAVLSGPGGTDFDLYLLRWNGSNWVRVAKSEGATSSESITYNAASGDYSWEIAAYQGSGTYSLAESR